MSSFVAAFASMAVLAACSFYRRPTRSPTPSSDERIGAPLGPIPPGNPSPLPFPTTRPHQSQAPSWVRVVGTTRGTKPGEGPSGASSVGGEAGERKAGGSDEEAGRGGQRGASSRGCAKAVDFSQRRRWPSGSDTRSGTCGGWGAKACCRGSSCRGASTCVSRRRTSSGSSTARAARRPGRFAMCRPGRSHRRRPGSEVA